MKTARFCSQLALATVTIFVGFSSEVATAQTLSCDSLFISAQGPRAARGVVSHLPTDHKGWLGGDAAYSRLRPGGDRIWLFGDSLIGTEVSPNERGPFQMYHNAVAIEHNGKFEYNYGKTTDGFFKNPRADEYYWPADLVHTDGKVFVFLRRVHNTTGGAFGFELVGNDLGIVENPQDDPSAWRVSIKPLGFEKVSLGAAAAASKTHINFFVDGGGFNHSLYLARIAIQDLNSDAPSIQFFNPIMDAWSPIMPRTPTIVNGSPELSLSFVPATREWRIVMTKGGLSNEIQVLTSKLLTQWKKPPTLLFQVSDSPEGDFAYAGKEVDTGGHDLEITYSINSSNPAGLHDESIYVPRLVRP